MTRSLTTVLVSTLALTACPAAGPGSDATPGQARERDGVTYHAESRLLERDPAAVQTVATVINTSGEPREITFPDGCTVLIRAYADEERSGPPVWEQERIAVCTLALQIVQLAPGDSVRYSMGATVPEILGDSLPPGRYYLGALLRPDQDRLVVAAGAVDLEI